MRKEQSIVENLKINQYTKDKLKIMRDMALVNISMKMAPFILGNTKTVREMVMGNIEKEQQEIAIGDNIKMVIGMGKEN
mgnify:CR=1 FL=1|jgi:hypothetical protein